MAVVWSTATGRCTCRSCCPDQRESLRRHLRRIRLHFGNRRGQIEALRHVVTRIVPGRFILVAEAEVERQPADSLSSRPGRTCPRIRRADRAPVRRSSAMTVERAEQEGGEPEAVVLDIGTREGLGGQFRREEEVRGVSDEADAVPAPVLDSGFQVVRAALLRDLGVVSLPSGFWSQ